MCFERVDGVRVANSGSDLLDGTLQNTVGCDGSSHLFFLVLSTNCHSFITIVVVVVLFRERNNAQQLQFLVKVSLAEFDSQTFTKNTTTTTTKIIVWHSRATKHTMI
jgi:hypothetical protein